MDLNNVPSSLMKGVSKEDFDKLLETLRSVMLEECINSLNNYEELIEEIKRNSPNEKTEKWINDFKNQVANSTEIIKARFENIEVMFNRIFEDWEKYKVEHVNEFLDKVDVDKKNDDVKDEGDIGE